MKTSLLILFYSLFLIPIAYSQKYHPFPTSDATWHTFVKSSCNEDTPAIPFVLDLYMDGDSLLNNQTYHKLYFKSGQNLIWGLIREEDKKIYYLGNSIIGYSDYEEYLLYDFNAVSGDTVWHDQNPHCYSVVLEIDSIKINESYRKRFKVAPRMDYMRDYDYWIEGIGSVVNGLMGSVTDIPTCGYHYWEFVCFKQDGEILYLNPNYDDCAASNVMAIDELPSVEKIDVCFDSQNSLLHLSRSDTKQTLRVQIIDYLGRQCFSDFFTENDYETKLCLEQGIYLIIVSQSDGKILLQYKFMLKSSF